MLRATCSADFHRCRPDSNDTKDTRVFAGSRRKTYRDQEKRVFSSKLPTTCNVRCTQAKSENNVQQRRKKHGQREILQSRDLRQVPNKRRVEVQSQNRDLLTRDVCTCLACPKTFPRSLTSLEETRRCHSYFTRMVSRTSSESDSSCNRVSNATDSVNGLISSKSS